jgi:hypothetical protein
MNWKGYGRKWSWCKQGITPASNLRVCEKNTSVRIAGGMKISTRALPEQESIPSLLVNLPAR